MRFGTLQSVLGEPLETVFEVAAKLGFEGVELDWSAPDQSFDAPRLRERAAQSGATICSVAAHFLNNANLANPEGAGEAQDQIRVGIELCSELGAGVLLVPFFGAAEITDETEPLLIEPLRSLAEHAAVRGVRLGIETARRADAMKRVFDAVNSPFVGAYWDMANGLSLGYDSKTEIETLRDHIVQVHAKEWSGPRIAQAPRQYPGLNQVPFGQGDVSLQTTFQALKNVGYDGWIVLETGAFDNAHTSAHNALETLKQFA